MVFIPRPPFHSRHTVTSGEETAGLYSGTYKPTSGNKRVKITYIVMFNEDTPFTRIECSGKAFSGYYNYFISSHQEGYNAKILDNKPIIVENIEEFEWIFYGVSANDVCRISIYFEVEE